MKARTVLVVGGILESLIRFRGDLLQTLQAAGYDVHAAAGTDDDPAARKTLQDWNIPFHHLPLGRASLNPVGDLAFLVRFYRLCRTLRPDYVLSYTLKPVLYVSLAAALAGVPGRYSMITGLGYTFAEGGAKRKLLRSLVINPLLGGALKVNHTVFFQNPDDIALFRSAGLLGQDQTVRLIGGSGVNLQEFQPMPYPQAPSFVLAARLLSEKGIREFVEAAGMVKRTCPSCRFRVLGWIDPQNPASIGLEEIEAWRAQGVVEFLGRLPDVRPVIADSSVYVLPSYYREGVPRSILEAMAMARPIITTDMPGCRETVRDGENGFLIPARSAEAIASAMRRFVETPGLIECMGQASRRMAHERFDVNKVNRDILEAMGL